MSEFPEGNALVYCQGAFGTTNGKTAHGLVRRTERYNILSVIDSGHAGADAGEVLDGRRTDIPIFADIDSALEAALTSGKRPTYFVIGLAPDGGRLPQPARTDILKAVRNGLNIDSGLHDYLSEDPEISQAAAEHGVVIRDVRKPPDINSLHFFSGKIEDVKSFKIAYLGTDSAVGKRTSAWILMDSLKAAGYSAELVGTGQTSWMQGVRYGVIMDSLVNDFVAGELEHATWSAWQEARPDIIILEGQGSLLNPAYPGGFEILAATRPDVIILQHAPARTEYDGFPGYRLHPLEKQIAAVELISEKKVVAVTVNHEGLDASGVTAACEDITKTTGLPAFDLLDYGAEGLVAELKKYIYPIDG